MMTANIYGLFYAHRLMYQPFVCKIIPPQATICSYIPLASIPLQSISSTQQKQTKRVGRGRGVCHPFAKNSRQPPYPCFCLISLASTTDKLIFESCVLVTYLTSAVALCLPPVLLCLYPSRLARESYLVLADVPLPITATQQHAAYI